MPASFAVAACVTTPNSRARSLKTGGFAPERGLHGNVMSGGNEMERSLRQLEDTVRKRICAVCTDRTVDSECGLENPSECALFRLFPHVAQAIQSTNSDDIRDYISAIRGQVCSRCNEQAPDGSCETRREVRCALDAYLLLVVDAIEDATGKTFDRTWMRIANVVAGQKDFVPERSLS